ncbi:PGPGW domain-containing protein [Aeromicrobium sp. NPDC092404]|uniref:PGPGW domain-containing protein n=1 Tax=Aeromicrobium sp. NPDC092404 TaxID=3154976 RepID=UPI00342B5D3C
MGAITSLKSLIERLGVEILGWILIPVGLVLMPLPGPGMLIVVAGVAMLSRRHVWAQRMLDPLRRRAVEAAKYGVATWPRIVVSFLGGVWLVALGVVWWVSPEIPEFSILSVGFGPELPAHGWGTALGLWASAIAAWALLAYSVVRWREPRPESRRETHSNA